MTTSCQKSNVFLHAGLLKYVLGRRKLLWIHPAGVPRESVCVDTVSSISDTYFPIMFSVSGLRHPL